MCQAVKTLKLPASCFGVDTWQGDEHAGFYPDDVYRNLALFHDPRYGAFSRLVRSTFDDALAHFENGSVDLLNIDGLHTYEAVRHDYESWLPKLSTNAIVLFHDTNVREGSFAVHRFWREISENLPHFEFLHGHGLGVLARGDSYSVPLSLLFDAQRIDTLAAKIRLIFAQLGHLARLPFELREREAEINALEATISTIQRSISWRVTAPLRAVKKGLSCF
jgi:O-antigen biosynthesis protein